jgi:hypothetical protein
MSHPQAPAGELVLTRIVDVTRRNETAAARAGRVAASHDRRIFRRVVYTRRSEKRGPADDTASRGARGHNARTSDVVQHALNGAGLGRVVIDDRRGTRGKNAASFDSDNLQTIDRPDFFHAGLRRNSNRKHGKCKRR